MTLATTTITELLKRRASQNADDLAFRFMANGELDGPVEEWTFSELYARSLGVAEELVSEGHVGTSVLLVFPPGLDFVKAFYGCLIAGVRAVPVPLPNPRSPNPLGRIAQTAAACGATTVMTTEPFVAMAAAMGSDLPVRLKAVTDRTGAAWDGSTPDMSDVAYLQFTSGSTGHPKGVAVAHRNIVSNLRVMGEMLRIKPTSPAFVWAPHYHDLCLVGHILGPAYHGFESTLMSPMDFLIKPVRWLRAMSHYRVVNTACPNFGYEYAARRVDSADCEGLDLSQWLVAGNGGEPVHEHTMDAFTDKFAPHGFRRQAFMPTYGMAESVLFVTGLKSLTQPPNVLTASAADLEGHTVRELAVGDDSERAARLVSCGKPGSGHRVLAVDPASLTPSAPGQVGELWVSGPSVPSSYWGLPDVSSATFGARLAGSGEGPFLRTGDLGFVADDEVYLTGRLKDLIIIAGRNHYPSDIEMTVQRSGAPVRPGCCVAVSVTADGQEELAVITEVDPKKLPAPEADEVTQAAFWGQAAKAVRGAVSGSHGVMAGSVVFVEPRSLEKTSSGKPRRRHYKKQLIEGALEVLHQSRSPAST